MRTRWRPWLNAFLFSLSAVLVCVALALLLIPTPVQLLAIPNMPPEFLLTLLLVSLLSALVVPPFIRTWLSRYLPIQPSSSTHLVALYLSLYLFSWLFLNLFLVGGVDGLQEEVEAVPLWLLAVQAGIFVVFALVGVGFPFRRSWRSALTRLGLDAFPPYILLVVPVSVIALVSFNILVSIIWTLVDPAGADAIRQLSDSLLGDYETLGAGLMLGLLPGISEEVLFRGAIQPGLGLLYTSLLFATVHLQYAISPATLAIFILGLALGLLRRRFGTWAAILTHFGYNFSLFLLGLIASKVLETVG
jgi:membrane protease YdiL (CAAX protease family)